MNPFNTSDSSVHAVAARILTLLAFLSAVGGLSAALTKAMEDLSWIKIAFNNNFLTAWLEQRLTAPEKKRQRIFGLNRGNLKATKSDLSVQEAWNEMVTLCAAGDERALLELEADQICGQLNSAAQIALAYPTLYRHLFGALTAGALPSDIAEVGQPLQTGPDGAVVVSPARQGAQTRVSNYIQRSVDALHIRLDQRWGWWQQVVNFLFGAGVAVAAMCLGGYFSSAHIVGDVIKIGFAAVATAFLAPLARDLSAAVKGWNA